jgi:DNA-binding winged helix-turn-helix (wHTH) protein/TolB-like protein
MTYAFGVFRLDSVTLELTRQGRPVRIEPQPARALALLLEKAGEVVSREDLRHAIWGDGTHVDYDRGLAYLVGQVRTALGDSAETPRFVQTLPKRGFRFIAPVTVVRPDGVAPDPSAQASASAAAAAVATTAAPLAQATIAPGSVAPAAAAAAAPVAASPPPPGAGGARWPWLWALAGAVAVLAALAGWRLVQARQPVVVAVSIFDNETGDPAYDGFVTGLSDVVVARLTSLGPGRLGVVGNLAALRQPRNIRNLRTLAEVVDADYVVLGQLQRQDDRLRFIVHFIRLSDGVHLLATRFVRPVSELRQFEADVVTEAERAVGRFAMPPS